MYYIYVYISVTYIGYIFVTYFMHICIYICYIYYIFVLGDHILRNAYSNMQECCDQTQFKKKEKRNHFSEEGEMV
jgi:hypothetical protein